MIWLWISLGIIGLIVIAFIVLSFVIGHLALHAKGPWCTDKNEPLPYFEGEENKIIGFANIKYYQDNGEHIYIVSKDNFKLHGKWFKNDNANKTIILVHGYRGKPEVDFCLILDWLRKLNDCNILLINSRAHAPSEGKYITMGVKERDDLHLWVEHIHKTCNLPIYIWGISMGCATTLMSLYRPYEDYVKGIIADCGYTSPYEQNLKMVKKYTGKSLAKLVLGIVNIYSKTFAKINLKGADTRVALKNNTIPILFTHGTSDDFVPSYMTEENYKACKSKKELLLIKNASHARSFVIGGELYKEKVLELFRL